MRTFATLSAALAALSLASAQTFTDCDPTKKTCPNNPGLNQADYSVDFTNGLPKDWTATSGSISASPNGGQFRISKLGDGPTVQSNWYFFYGRVEAKIRAAPGAGIVSSLVLQSSDLDEIDWEWIGSDTARAQSNYFGKGNTTTYDRGGFHNVQTPAATFHTYAIDWTKSAITWSIDGVAVRTLNYADANGGRTFPQTPMNVRLGDWVGGTPGNAQGTIEWAGGLADMSKGPFDMYVTSLTVKNLNPAAAYQYSDMSGSSDSIRGVTNGQTTPLGNTSPSGTTSPPAGNTGSGTGSSPTGGAGSSSPPSAGGSGAPSCNNGCPGNTNSQNPSGPAGSGSVAPPPGTNSGAVNPPAGGSSGYGSGSASGSTLVATPSASRAATTPSGVVSTPRPSSTLVLSNSGADVRAQKVVGVLAAVVVAAFVGL